MSDLEPLFAMSWNGWPTEDFEIETPWHGRYDIFECRRCGALVCDPHKHFAWHGLVDSNQAVVGP